MTKKQFRFYYRLARIFYKSGDFDMRYHNSPLAQKARALVRNRDYHAIEQVASPKLSQKLFFYKLFEGFRNITNL